MRRYVSFMRGDPHPQLICPGCSTPFSDKNPLRSMSCGHIECEDCNKRRRRCLSSKLWCCKASHRRELDGTIFKGLVTKVNMGTRSTEKEQCFGCGIYTLPNVLYACVMCKESPLCRGCLLREHRRHGWAKRMPDKTMEPHPEQRKYRHSIDHSAFPDRRVLEMNGKEIVVSGTLLATQSSYFELLFSTSPDIDSFSIDADPEIFEDLLDMIYPRRPNLYRRTFPTWETYEPVCCLHCKGVLFEQLKLMVRFDFASLIYRFHATISLDRIVALYGDLNDGWEAFKKYVVPRFADYDDFLPHPYYSADSRGNKLSHLKPFFDTPHEFIRVPPALPYRPNPLHSDTRLLSFGGAPVVVSATILCLHAPGLIDFFYGEKNREKREIEFDLCTIEVFEKFMNAVNGDVKIENDKIGFHRFLRSVDARIILGVSAWRDANRQWDYGEYVEKYGERNF